MRKNSFISAILILFLTITALPLNVDNKAQAEVSPNDFRVQIKNDTGSSREVWVWDKRPEIGIGVHPPQFENQSLQAVNVLGIRLVRTTMQWWSVEWDKPGRYAPEQLAKWDKIVGLAQKNNIELEVVVHSPNPKRWGYANRNDAYKAFGNFMYDMVKKYPQIHYWELFNEMNVTVPTIFGGGEKELTYTDYGKNYGEMLKVVYPKIKEGNPNAIVLMGGMLYWKEKPASHKDFLAGVYGAGAKQYFDIANLHTYGLVKGSLWDNYVIEAASKTRAIMSQYNDSQKPLWDTEWGVDADMITRDMKLPTTWNIQDYTKDDPPECSWKAMSDPVTYKFRNDGDGYDYMQCRQWKKVIDGVKSLRNYDKIIGFQYLGENEEYGKVKYDQVTLPKGMNIDDYGFGIVRYTSQLPRPTYNWLKSEQVNQELHAQKSYQTDISISGSIGFVPKGYDFAYSGDQLIVKNVVVDSLMPTKIFLTKDIDTSKLLFKTVDKKAAYKGDTITYTLTLDNHTPQTLTSLVVKDNVPAGTTYVASSAGTVGKYDSKLTQIKWSVPSLAPGEKKVYSYKVKAN